MDALLPLLSPVVVALATQFVKVVAPLPKIVTVGIVAPVFSAVATYFTVTMIPGTPHWYFQFALGLAGTWLFEVAKKLKESGA